MQPAAVDTPPPAGPSRLVPWAGLMAGLILVTVAAFAPGMLGWEVYPFADPDREGAAPLHAEWGPRMGQGTALSVLAGLLGLVYGPGLADRLPWRALLVTTYVAALGWMLALALLDGTDGIAQPLAHPYEYLETARVTDDFPAALDEWIGRIPLDSENNWPTHVAGHPPGALLFFVALDRIGLAGNLSAGIAVTLVAASVPAAVMSTARRLGAEGAARKAAPFLVLGPAALWMCVSADGVFAAAGAWGLCALACAATAGSRGRQTAWAAVAGVLLGSCVMMSYGLPLLGVLSLAVLAAASCWRPLPIAAASATAVVLAFAVGGYALWEAFPVLRERYWDGVASDRPTSYWIWANLAVLVLSAGPVVGAALAALWSRRGQEDRAVVLLVGAAAASIVLADASLMSKAEVERIWLPFVPWLLLATAALPPHWRRASLAVQIAVALILQHVLLTDW